MTYLDRDTFAAQVMRHLGTKRGNQARIAESMGLSPAFVSNVLHGRHVPANPVPWADALGLVGEDRARLLVAATMDRASPEVRSAILGVVTP